MPIEIYVDKKFVGTLGPDFDQTNIWDPSKNPALAAVFVAAITWTGDNSQRQEVFISTADGGLYSTPSRPLD